MRKLCDSIFGKHVGQRQNNKGANMKRIIPFDGVVSAKNKKGKSYIVIVDEVASAEADRKAAEALSKQAATNKAI